MIGERLKHDFSGNDAWVLSFREECFDQIGLKPSIKIPVFNGSLECEFRKYAMFDGKMREFRSEGGIVKTEEEKREMAEKHRFKKNREFKKRLDEQESNEEGDIRSFSFHHHELDLGSDRRRECGDRRRDFSDRRGDFGDRRKEFGDRRGEFKGRGDDRRGRSDARQGDRGFYGGKRFDRSGKHTGKFGGKRRFNDEEE